MRANGILFLNKARPTVGTTPKGDFLLTLTALHRISANQAELWRVFYSGQRAQDLWDTCKEVLLPGQPIQVDAQQIRVHANGTPLIEAIAQSIAIAPRSHLGQQQEGGVE